MTKLFFGGLDLLRPEVIEPTKMPRSAAIPVVRDPATGYLNAATYSAGVFSLDPLVHHLWPQGRPGHRYVPREQRVHRRRAASRADRSHVGDGA